MIQLYFDPACPFCIRVLDFLAEQEIPFEPRQISLGADSDTRRELIEMTGRSTVPFLVDPERDVRMHESLDIIDYIRTHYDR
ncbi:MAG TPA: glutaredoxin [bacterium]|nr:glutaredoxin [bacterium]